MRKPIVFILLLTVMGMLIPNITKAETQQDFKVLNIEWINDYEPTGDVIDHECESWNLTPQQVQIYFETATPGPSMMKNAFDNYSCSVRGELIWNGIQGKYRINMGGFGFWEGETESDVGPYRGCMEGACREFTEYYTEEELNQK